MILNSLNNQFVVQFQKGFFYPEIRERWTPVVNRMKLPYEDLESFINASIQNITFPSVELDGPEQGQGHYKIKYRPGKALEPLIDKNLTLTFKLSEGFISYWILFEQIELFQQHQDTEPFWPPMFVSFLDHHGFELVAFNFEKIIPTNLSQFEVSYSTTAAQFNTFSMTLRYNRFNIKRRVSSATYTDGNSKDI